MKTAIINKINKIKSRKSQRDVYERPSLQLPIPEPRPRESDKSKEAPVNRVIVIDLM